jgi:hypothetical protein
MRYHRKKRGYNELIDKGIAPADGCLPRSGFVQQVNQPDPQLVGEFSCSFKRIAVYKVNR